MRWNGAYDHFPTDPCDPRLNAGPIAHGTPWLTPPSQDPLGAATRILPTLNGTAVVGAAQVNKLQGAGVPVFDARVPLEYAEGHIPLAVSEPYFEHSGKTVNFNASKDRFKLTKPPSDKAAPLVIYCNGPECWKSFKLSSEAVKAGYTRIYWFRGGFPAWKAAGFPVATSAQ